MQFTTTFVAAVAALSTLAFAAPTSLESRGSAHTGTATYFFQNGNPGSCGNYNSDDAYIVAVSGLKHSASNCGKTITISANGVEKVATIADTCPSCALNDLDLSYGLFTSFADANDGVFEMTWWANW